MTFHRVALLIGSAIGFAASAGVCGWLLAVHAPDYHPGTLFLDTDSVLKAPMILCGLLWIPIMALGLAGLFGRSRGGGEALHMLGLVSALLGLFGGAYALFRVQMAIRAVGPVSLDVTALSYAEGALATMIGLLGATVAFGLGAVGARRR